MSFNKALQLIHLAQMAAVRHGSVSLKDIEDAFGCSHRTAQRLAERFGVSHRTAQRMTAALEQAFPHAVEVFEDEERRKRWKLREQPIARMRLGGDAELEALDYAVARLA
ncbi:hypothetical protein ACFQ2S_22600, partial [Tropicimonas aquimaris]